MTVTGSSTTFTIGSGGTLNITNDTFASSSALVVASGGTLGVRGSNSASTIAGTFTVNAGGKVTIGANSSFINTDPKLTVSNGFTNAGTITLDDDQGGSNRSATLTVSSGTLANTGTLQTLNTSSNSGSRTINAQLDNQSGGIVNINDTATIGKTGAAHTSSGTINIAASQTLFFTGDSFTNQSGGVINITTGGTLNTSGVTTYTQGGTLNTGLSPGIGTIIGNISQSASGILVSEIAGIQVGDDYDQLNVSGSFQMGGTLDVQLLDSFTPTAGNSFQVLTFGSATGSFDAINGLDLGTSMVLDAAVTSTNLTLTATAATVSGTAAGETLSGTAGDDVISAGDGDDILIGGAGNDLLFGGLGTDTVDYSAATGGITVDLGVPLAQVIGGGEGTDFLNGIENVIGGSGDDVLSGNSGDNVLTGNAGADALNLGENDGGSDIVRYTAFSDGATDLTLTSADTITQFEAGIDKIQILNAGISLNGTGVVSVASGAADLTGTTNGVFYVNNATAADLGSFANVGTAIGTLATVGAGEKAVFLVQDGAGKTGIYAFTDDGGANTAVVAAELDLLAVVNTAITDADMTVV